MVGPEEGASACGEPRQDPALRATFFQAGAWHKSYTSVAVAVTRPSGAIAALLVILAASIKTLPERTTAHHYGEETCLTPHHVFFTADPIILRFYHNPHFNLRSRSCHPTLRRSRSPIRSLCSKSYPTSILRQAQRKDASKESCQGRENSSRPTGQQPEEWYRM